MPLRRKGRDVERILNKLVYERATTSLDSAVEDALALKADIYHDHEQGSSFGNEGSGNYAEFEADGTLQFYGDASVFRDEFGDITKLKLQGSGITESATENTMGFDTGCAYASDYLWANFQFNHDRKLGAPVFPHIHWFQTENTTPNFLVLYRWQLNGKAKTTAWSLHKMTTSAFTYVSGTLNQISYGTGLTPPSDDNVSTLLQVRITRDKTNASGAFTGSDTYTASAATTSFDIHIELDSVGSRTEYSK